MTTIEQAVAALEVAQHEIIGFTVSLAERDGVKPSTDYAPLKQIIAALAALRASTGKSAVDVGVVTHALEEFYKLTYPKYFSEKDMPARRAIDAFKRIIQADALAAAQPEPRPLRELIAEGCKHLWIFYKARWRIVFIWEKYKGQGEGMTIVGWARQSDCLKMDDYLECPAIPILKPAIEGGGK